MMYLNQRNAYKVLRLTGTSQRDAVTQIVREFKMGTKDALAFIRSLKMKVI